MTRTPRQRVRLMLLRAFARVTRSPTPQLSDPTEVRKASRRGARVLVIRPDHLGDLLFSTPALRILRQRYPDLFDRAVAIKRNADLSSIKGLGRSFSWEAYARADEAQGRLFPEVIETACICWDGDSDDDEPTGGT